jgi:stage II sporulation protein AA (anti-sigma F factor antagonist)
MEIIETSLSGVPLLRVVGDVDHFTSLALDDAVCDALNADGSHLLLDLTECPYLDSGGLGVILTALRTLRAKGWLGIIGCSPDLVRLFTISGLTAEPEFRLLASLHDTSVAVAEDGA